eukprot:1287482-Rhodomonas_salina.4
MVCGQNDVGSKWEARLKCAELAGEEEGKGRMTAALEEPAKAANGRSIRTHRDTQTHRHTDTQTHRHTDTQTHRHRERERETDRHRQTQTRTDTERHRQRDREIQRYTETHTNTHIHAPLPFVGEVWVGSVVGRDVESDEWGGVWSES